MLPETKKDNKITVTEKKPKVNPYYLVLSGRFKTAKYITLCILVVFLLANVILFRDEITIENLRYLFKDLEMGDNVNVSSTETIRYDADAQVQLALYKGDLVVSGGSYFYLCDLQGNKRYSQNSVFTNPVVLSGDKYLLVFGLSENTYTVYNTFSQLHTESLDYPITGAALSDKGMYAIVTRTAEYRSVVYLYNENFERIGAVYKDKYIIDVKFNKESTELLITSLYSKDGGYCTEIMNYAPFSQNASSTIDVSGAMALKTGYNGKGGYSIIYDSKIEFYGKDFVLKSTYEYAPGVVPVTAEITDSYTVITYNENIVGNSIKALVFDTEGQLVLTADAEGQPKKIKSNNDFVFILVDGSVVRIALADGSVDYYDTERNAIDLLLVDDKNILVCFVDHTSKITLD